MVVSVRGSNYRRHAGGRVRRFFNRAARRADRRALRYTINR